MAQKFTNSTLPLYSRELNEVPERVFTVKDGAKGRSSVEPAGAPKVTTSLRAGKPTTLETVSGIADGLLAVRPGDLTFPHIQAFVDEVVLVDDEAIVDAMRFLFSAARLVAEPSGAATVAAARGAVVSKLVVRGPTGGAAQGDSGPEVALVSGGNVEPDAFGRHIRGAA